MMRQSAWFVLLFLLVGLNPPDAAPQQVTCTIKLFPGDHKEDGFWTAISAARDGRVYVGLCSHGGSGRFYVYEPQAGVIRHIAMMDDALHALHHQAAPQEKIHSQIHEDSQGRIWFGTDMGYHHYLNMWDDPRAYPGGHLLRYNPADGALEDLGIPLPGSAVRILTLDEPRNRLYGVGFPTGQFWIYDLKTGLVDVKGRVNNTDSIARLMVQDDEGNVYGSFAPYRIFKYDIRQERLLDLPVIIPHMEGPWSDRGHFHRENVWRNVIWHPKEKVMYGLEMGSATLFRFDPRTLDMRDLGQMVVPELEGSRIVPYSSHAFILNNDNTIWYAAPAAGKTDPCHVIEYNINTGVKRDLGKLVDPATGHPYILQGVTRGPDGTLYFAGWIRQNDQAQKSGPVMGLVIVQPAGAR